MRTRELRQVRRLAERVLLQRSEVEAFLVSSIQLVRDQLAAEAAGTGAPAPAAAGPAGAGSACTEQVSAVAGEGAGEMAGQLEGAASVAASNNNSSSCLVASEPAGSCSAPDAAAGVMQGSPTSCGAAGPKAAAAAAAPAAGAPAVDIRALSWQDRERVLRLLFAKINRAAQVRWTSVHSSAQARLLSTPCYPGYADQIACMGLLLVALQTTRTAACRNVNSESVLCAPKSAWSSAPRHLQPVARPPAEPAPLPPLRGLATEAGPAGLA